jgi:hypothetical protein
MSRVRLTAPYRYLIYVTPDYAIVEGLDLGTGQEAMRTSRHSDPLVLEKYSMVTTNNNNKESKMLVLINDKTCIHCCRKKSGRKQVESKSAQVTTDHTLGSGSWSLPSSRRES